MNTKQEDHAREWTERIKRAYEFRDKKFRSAPSKTYKQMCIDNRQYYRGDWNKTIIPVNRIFSYGRSLVPSVYFRNPRVSVTATRPELVVHARVVEAVDNWVIFETNLKKTLKRAILNAYICGCGPVKLGYDSQYGYIPEQAVDQDRSTVTQSSRTEDRKIEYREGVKPGMPWALPDLPENIIGPPGYDDYAAMPWIAHRIIRPLDDVKQDQKYKHTKDLQGTKTLDYIDPKQQSLFREDKLVPLAELFEIRDKSTGLISVVCEGQTLLSENDVLQVEGLPWEFLIFNDDPEYPWGIPDVCMMEPQQLELNEIRTQAKRHRAIALLKFLYKRGAIKEPELEKFFSGSVGPGVAIDDDAIANAIVTLQPHIPPDLAAEARQVESDLRQTIRISENQAGSYRSGTPPRATETQEVAQSFDLNVDERKDLMGDLLTSIIRKWNQYIFKFWDGNRVVQIAGPDGQMWWVQYTGDELEGEYNLRIDPDTGFPVTRGIRMEAAAGLLKQYGGDQLIDQTELRKMHLSQLEWLYPGISRLVMEAPPQIASAVSNLRQPGPEKGQGHLPVGQRGGGRGTSQEKPIEFGEFKKKFEAGKGSK